MSKIVFVFVLSAILVWPSGLAQGLDPVVVTITNPANNASFPVSENINFSATTVGGTPPYAFVWDFGDGSTLAGPVVTKSYSVSGAKTVTVTSSDFEGIQAAATLTLNIQPVTPPPQALTVIIDRPANNAVFLIEQNIEFNVSASGGAPPYSFVWDFGDGTTIAGNSYTKFYSATGTKTVMVRGVDFAGTSQSQTISLNIKATTSPPTPTDPLTISNIRVTDITSDNAIVRWTTSKPASSRVIYDSVSHPSLAGQSAPNFGYASSTPTIDTDARVIEHAVTVTALQPSTTYYFRVLSQ